MAGARFDHLVVAAADLAAGVRWFAQCSGVGLPAGGQHPRMGTHNHVGALAGDGYVEVIANDPSAPVPSEHRWFGLDQPDVARALKDGPRLHTWVIAVDDLPAAIESARTIGLDYGAPVAMTRGDLRWSFAIAPSGAMVLDGAAPQLIAWPDGPHVSKAMQPTGLGLKELTVRTPEASRLADLFDLLGLEDPRVTLQASTEAALSATLYRPDGQFVSIDRAKVAA